ncbi:MAG: SemiSWEET family sugar transporter [Gammaproteobacteria bacterium]
MTQFTHFIDFVFGAGLFINALLFVPQAIRIYKCKESKDLSLITFVGFCLIQLSAIIYGFLHHDYILMYGYMFSLFTCGVVTVLGIYYRLSKR